MVMHAEHVDWSTVRGPVLLAGDAHHVPEMQGIAQQLPSESNVTILIEAFSRVQTYRVKVPDNVSVIWLVRDRQFTDASPCAVRTRGHRLAVAVRAWLSEWMCATDGDDVADCTVWLAARTPPHIVRMARAVLDAGRAPRRGSGPTLGDHSNGAGRSAAPRRQEN